MANEKTPLHVGADIIVIASLSNARTDAPKLK